MYYVFIDTNIYVSLMSQNKSGNELKYFEDLKSLIEAKIIRLLVPEVIVLELDKIQRNISKDFTEEFGNIKKAISKTPVWSEIRDIKYSLIKTIEQKSNEKFENWKKNYEKIKKFFISNIVENIPFTPEILCRSKKRLISGKTPALSSSKIAQDIFIIESLIFEIGHLLIKPQYQDKTLLRPYGLDY